MLERARGYAIITGRNELAEAIAHIISEHGDISEQQRPIWHSEMIFDPPTHTLALPDGSREADIPIGRQTELLTFFLHHTNTPTSVETLRSKIWNDEQVTIKTIQLEVRNLRKRLEDFNEGFGGLLTISPQEHVYKFIDNNPETALPGDTVIDDDEEK